MISITELLAAKKLAPPPVESEAIVQKEEAFDDSFTLISLDDYEAGSRTDDSKKTHLRAFIYSFYLFDLVTYREMRDMLMVYFEVGQYVEIGHRAKQTQFPPDLLTALVYDLMERDRRYGIYTACDNIGKKLLAWETYFYLHELPVLTEVILTLIERRKQRV